jgi:drug/metabolite transporter (DMT)-like permease
MLRERVGMYRWIATLGGFLGVLLVLRPDTGRLAVVSLLAVAALIMVAMREVLTRGLDCVGYIVTARIERLDAYDPHGQVA